MEFQLKIDGLDDIKNRLSKEQINNAITATLNRGAEKVVTEASAGVREVINIPKKYFDQSFFSIRRATWDRPAVVIVSANKRVPLIEFNPSMKIENIRTRFGKRFMPLKGDVKLGTITYSVQRGKVQTMDNVLMGNLRYGPQVFSIRKNMPRGQRLKALYTLSGNQAMRFPSVIARLRANVVPLMKKTFLHEIEYRSSK